MAKDAASRQPKMLPLDFRRDDIPVARLGSSLASSTGEGAWILKNPALEWPRSRRQICRAQNVIRSARALASDEIWGVEGVLVRSTSVLLRYSGQVPSSDTLGPTCTPFCGRPASHPRSDHRRRTDRPCSSDPCTSTGIQSAERQSIWLPGCSTLRIRPSPATGACKS